MIHRGPNKQAKYSSSIRIHFVYSSAASTGSLTTGSGEETEEEDGCSAGAADSSFLELLAALREE